MWVWRPFSAIFLFFATIISNIHFVDITLFLVPLLRWTVVLVLFWFCWRVLLTCAANDLLLYKIVFTIWTVLLFFFIWTSSLLLVVVVNVIVPVGLLIRLSSTSALRTAFYLSVSVLTIFLYCRHVCLMAKLYLL